MGIIIFLVVSGVVGAMILSRFERGGTGFLLGLFLGPIGWIIAFVMRSDLAAAEVLAAAKAPPPTAWEPARVERECPHCAELVLAKAKVCKHCGKDLEPVVPPDGPPAPGPIASEAFTWSEDAQREWDQRPISTVVKALGAMPAPKKPDMRAPASKWMHLAWVVPAVAWISLMVVEYLEYNTAAVFPPLLPSSISLITVVVFLLLVAWNVGERRTRRVATGALSAGGILLLIAVIQAIQTASLLEARWPG